MDYEAEYNKLKDEFDALKSDSRKWEDRSKANHKDLQDAQAALADRDKAIEDANSRLADLEAANGDMHSKLTQIDQDKAHAEMVKEVAEAKGVDASVLRGATKEEIEAHADTLNTVFKPSAPVIDGQANTPGEQPVDELREFTRDLFSTED